MNTSLGLLQSVGIGFAAIVLVAVVAIILFILTSAVIDSERVREGGHLQAR
jgi:hypothetical protein